MDFWMQRCVNYLELRLGCLALNRYSFCSVIQHMNIGWKFLNKNQQHRKKQSSYVLAHRDSKHDITSLIIRGGLFNNHPVLKFPSIISGTSFQANMFFSANFALIYNSLLQCLELHSYLFKKFTSMCMWGRLNLPSHPIVLFGWGNRGCYWPISSYVSQC